MSGASLAKFGSNFVSGLILGAESIDGAIGYRFHDGDEITDPVGVDREAEAGLGSHLVTVGNGDLTHVISEPDVAALLPVGPGARHAHPRGDTVLHLGIAPVTYHDLAWQPESGVDESMFPVAMRGLVEIHEVHVDLGPGQVLIELGREVEQRLAKLEQAVDPHLRRGEGVAPGDDTGTVGVTVGFEQGGSDFLGTRQNRLEDELKREASGGVELVNDGL